MGAQYLHHRHTRGLKPGATLIDPYGVGLLQWSQFAYVHFLVAG